MRRSISAALAVFALSTGVLPATAAPERKVPYWASIAAGQARMRTGPGRNFPASWLYQRADLPVHVIETYPSWRKIEDPDGTQGWMMVNLLSDTRTAIVIGQARAIHAAPSSSSPVVWRAGPGVVGRVSHCGAGWCAFGVHAHSGYIEVAGLWGVGAGEAIE